MNKKAVLLDDERIIKFDKCLIATGGRPRPLPMSVPPECEEDVTTFRTVKETVSTDLKLKDFQRLEKVSQEAEEIIIIGGGFLGSELACSLAAGGRSHKLKVTQVFPEKGMMGLVLPEYLSDWTTQHVKKGGNFGKRLKIELGVAVKSQRLVQSVASGTTRKVALTLDSGERLEADHVGKGPPSSH